MLPSLLPLAIVLASILRVASEADERRCGANTTSYSRSEKTHKFGLLDHQTYRRGHATLTSMVQDKALQRFRFSQCDECCSAAGLWLPQAWSRLGQGPVGPSKWLHLQICWLSACCKPCHMTSSCGSFRQRHGKAKSLPGRILQPRRLNGWVVGAALTFADFSRGVMFQLLC